MSEDFFDEVKQNRKIKTVRTSYSIRSDILEEFNKIAKNQNLNKSKVIENFLMKFNEREKSLVK